MFWLYLPNSLAFKAIMWGLCLRNEPYFTNSQSFASKDVICFLNSTFIFRIFPSYFSSSLAVPSAEKAVDYRLRSACLRGRYSLQNCAH